jgi:hypothetical protein
MRLGSVFSRSPSAEEVAAENLREQRVAAARRNRYWVELEETDLVRRGPWHVHAETDELLTRYRGAIFPTGMASIAFNDQVEMLFYVDRFGEVVFLEAQLEPAHMERGRRQASAAAGSSGMSHTALIRFAPLTTLERVNDERWKRPGRTMYDHGALTFAPGKSSVPLLVDHAKEREIGVVHTLTRYEDTDGPWLAAIAEITELPCWLRKYESKASFGYLPAGTSNDVFGCEIARRGLVTEVSVLSPGCKPAEPLAQVLTLNPTETPKTSVARVHAPVPAAAGGVVHDWAPREPQALAWADEARRRGSVVRIGTGHVLGVR